MEKPDFESMLKKNAFKIHPLDTERAAVSIDHADWCFEQVWNTHLIPLQESLNRYNDLLSERNELYHKSERLKIERDKAESENKLLREEIERLKAEMDSKCNNMM